MDGFPVFLVLVCEPCVLGQLDSFLGYLETVSFTSPNGFSRRFRIVVPSVPGVPAPLLDLMLCIAV